MKINEDVAIRVFLYFARLCSHLEWSLNQECELQKYNMNNRLDTIHEDEGLALQIIH